MQTGGIVESALGAVREAFEKLIVIKENETASLRELLEQRELQIEELCSANQRLQRNAAADQRRINELTHRLSKLVDFKNTIATSLSASEENVIGNLGSEITAAAAMQSEVAGRPSLGNYGGEKNKRQDPVSGASERATNQTQHNPQHQQHQQHRRHQHHSQHPEALQKLAHMNAQPGSTLCLPGSEKDGYREGATVGRDIEGEHEPARSRDGGIIIDAEILDHIASNKAHDLDQLTQMFDGGARIQH
ncbi:hypothetical protein HK105_208875 [Polyrhizophydium stewartii]|uniref:Uncharacterized protein n=1 Tax=Polyrhizophydium stewartii TaxID=2732419 RepID=A0ABR4MWK7_9FUNG